MYNLEKYHPEPWKDGAAFKFVFSPRICSDKPKAIVNLSATWESQLGSKPTWAKPSDEYSHGQYIAYNLMKELGPELPG